jgi:hypothetical protein
MDVIAALHNEEARLQRQLQAVKTAITVLNGGGTTSALSARTSHPNRAVTKRVMSAAVRAKIARSAKARWARVRAEKGAGKKAK